MNLTYDGHGINRNGERIFTGAKQPILDGGGYVLDDVERDRIGLVLAAAQEMLLALKECQSRLFALGDLTHGEYEEARAAIAKAEGQEVRT